MKKIKKAVITAADFGIDFLPATKAMPKEMLPIVDKPVIQFVVEEAIASGIEEILIISGKNKSSIGNHFDRNVFLEKLLMEKNESEKLAVLAESDVPNIYHIRQAYPNGLGDAILHAESFVGDEPFVILLGDDIMPNGKPLTKTLMDLYDKHQTPIIAMMKTGIEELAHSGVVEVVGVRGENLFGIRHVFEKIGSSVATNDLGIIGRYVMTPDIFPKLHALSADAKPHLQLTDAIEALNREQEVLAYEYQGERHDAGDKYGLLIANIELGLKHKETAQPLAEYLKELSKQLKRE
ncbi:UTP--glucose-1-phosphate uridylyltransferase [Trichococcus sp. K1Tr]|uniref:UTP--glucose-1-phosphate uridylyltransferase n=1 Tax=Trichococcus sp. K1Tr TaxID=3020847 RepID=UPI00232AC52F|nr:UTP--glucose-1-phosphate uridylyltransferase [Trichococcus sp. K1Tr]MDB6354120.1 UTP--glucose-1-phosphate uridylyltransferase [Trichococcus sp. K1Tr]